MARTLRRTVIVDGVTYPAGSSPSGEVAARITNPRVWDGDAVPSTTVAEGAPSPSATAPPRSGAGSGRDAWVAYAGEVIPDLEVTEKMGRDDVVAALVAAGVIAEEG